MKSGEQIHHMWTETPEDWLCQKYYVLSPVNNGFGKVNAWFNKTVFTTSRTWEGRSEYKETANKLLNLYRKYLESI